MMNAAKEMPIRQMGVICLAWCVTAMLAMASCGSEAQASPSPLHRAEVKEFVHVPRSVSGPTRLIAIDDLLGLRDVDAFAVSPNGARFAVLLRRADPARNTYVLGWFVGDVATGNLTFVGDGGEAQLAVRSNGSRGGSISGRRVLWSPDGRWIAYTIQQGGEVQLWRSNVDGTVQQQLTASDADVRDFAWSQDGRALYFTTSSHSRSWLEERGEHSRRTGIRFDEFQLYNDIVYEALPVHPIDLANAVWIVGSDGKDERRATEEEVKTFKLLKDRNYQWSESMEARPPRDLTAAASPPVLGPDGRAAWLIRKERQDGLWPLLTLAVSSSDGSNPVLCSLQECTARYFQDVWWSEDGKHIMFRRKEGTNVLDEDAFYKWTPATGEMATLRRSAGDVYKRCGLARTKLVCVRQTITKPDHIVSIDTLTGDLDVVIDLNPEFSRIKMGKVQRIEWKLPPDTANLGYPESAFGYIIYPPDFEPGKRYPAFISPYKAAGFTRGDVGDEHPLLVYAAKGMIVLNFEFPFPFGSFGDLSNAEMLQRMYSPALGFPHLKMLSESTFLGLDEALKTGAIDPKRIGIGGVSHGAFIPLFMLQKFDRLAAVSLGSPGWSQAQYYFQTQYGRSIRSKELGADWRQAWPKDLEFWSQIDIASHTEEIEAPLLMHYADREFFRAWQLPGELDDANRVYEAYIFQNEYHVKWQPAHREAIYERNLDWFSFWLQDAEDPDPDKRQQYFRWRKLRAAQCLNERSVRDFCGI